MKLLIDTNIVMDFFENRNEGEAARDLFKLAENNSQYECVTGSSITDILFLLTKAMRETNATMPKESRKTNKEVSLIAQNRLEQFLSIVHVLPVTENNIKNAFSLKWNDAEDALQYVVAKENAVDIIITNNKKDFECDDIRVMTAQEFLVSL